MNLEGFGATELNYRLGWTLGESLDTFKIKDNACIPSDGATVDDLNDPSLLDMLQARGLFSRNPNDTLINNGHADPAERFTAEIRRTAQVSCSAPGPTPIIAICRAIVAFAYRSCGLS